MATLGNIRKHGVLLVSVIAVALFLFVAGDLVKGGQNLFQKSQQTAAEIAGNTISIQEYQKMYEELLGYYEIANGSSVTGEDQINSIKDEAWQTFVQNTLIQKECEELGLAVTDNEVLDIIKSGQSQILQVPLFMNQQTGRYDYSLVQRFLTEYKQLKDSGEQVPEEYEKVYKYYMFAQKQIRNQYLVQKYQILLSKVLISNPVEAKMSFASHDSETDAILASIPVTSVGDDKVSVKDEEIKAKFNEEKEKYIQIMETRDIKFINVAVTANDADKKAAEEAMQDAHDKLVAANTNTAAGNVCRQLTSAVQFTDILKKKEAYPVMISNLLDSAAVGSVSAPQYDAMSNTYFTFKLLDKQTQADSVLYRQLYVAGESEAASQTSADSIVNAIKNGATYAEIAKKYGQKTDSVWITTAQIQNSSLTADDQKVANAIFDLEPNGIKAVKHSAGYNIIVQVLEKKNPITKYNVAAVVKTLDFSDNTYNSAFNKLSSFLAQNNTAEKIAANAEKEGYSLMEYPDVTTTQHNIANVHNTRDAIKWLFDEAKPGDVSQLYECGDNDHLLVVILDAVNEKGYRPYSKVEPVIKSELLNEKKVAYLAEQLKGVKSISEAVAKGAVVDTVNHISFANPTYVRATTSSEDIVSAAAAKAAKGAFVGPIKGEGGAYVMQVVNKNNSSAQFDAKQEQAQLAQMNMRNVLQSLVNTLYIKANVTDNRYKFF